MNQIRVFNSKEDRDTYEKKRKAFYSRRANILINGSIFEKIRLKWREHFDKKYKAIKRGFDGYCRGIWKTKNPNYYMGEVSIDSLTNIYNYKFEAGTHYIQIDARGKIVSTYVYK